MTERNDQLGAGTTREDCTQNDMTLNGYKIATWYSDGIDAPYMAINMTKALEMLDGYGLSDEEKTELPALMFGYFRLIEEAGLSGYGETEFESIRDLFSSAAPPETIDIVCECGRDHKKITEVCDDFGVIGWEVGPDCEYCIAEKALPTEEQ